MSSTDATGTLRIIRLIGVYDSDSTVPGGVASWAHSLLGRQQCALRSVTHGPLGRRREWKPREAALPVQFDTYHRDDLPTAVSDAAGGRSPVVVAETDLGFLPLLSVDGIAACRGSADQLVGAIENAAAVLRLTFEHVERAD